MISFFRKIRRTLLSQNKASRYLTYAFGEIVLVVIGILIAIQINDLYANRKQNKSRKINAGLLIENLVRDSLYITQWKNNVEVDKQTLESQFERMNSPYATIDTMIKIAASEYRPGVLNVFFSNQSVFNTMVSTGEINLFDKSLIEDLYQLYAYEKGAEDRGEYSFDHYLNSILIYKSKYFFSEDSAMRKSPLHQQVWKNIDEEDFITSFSSMFGTKMLLYNQVEPSVERVEQDINNVLPILRALSK